MEFLGFAGRRCRVLITEQVLDELNDWSSAKHPKIAMLSLITKSIPDSGPITTEPIGKSIGEDLFEFRKGERRGAKVRVLWFSGQGDDVVCVRAFVKTFQKTPSKEIELAKAERSRFREAIAQNDLEIIDGSDLVRKKR